MGGPGEAGVGGGGAGRRGAPVGSATPSGGTACGGGGGAGGRAGAPAGGSNGGGSWAGGVGPCSAMAGASGSGARNGRVLGVGTGGARGHAGDAHRECRPPLRPSPSASPLEAEQREGISLAAKRMTLLQLEQLLALQNLKTLRKEQLGLRLEQQRALYLLLRDELPHLQLAPMQRRVVADMVRHLQSSCSQLESCTAALELDTCVGETVRVVEIASQLDQTAACVSACARQLLSGLRDNPWRVARQPGQQRSPTTGAPLTAEQMSRIPLSRGPATSESCCAICLDGMAKNASLRVLRCGHAFHQRCVDAWLGVSNSCPLCKRPAL